MKKIIPFFAALGAPAMAVASERVDVCAEYSGTGQTYHVAAISTTGSELNEATDTLNYNFLSHYIVIFWEKDQTSVIEMDGSFVGPTYVQSGGKDQEGRSWEISARNGCLIGVLQFFLLETTLI